MGDPFRKVLPGETLHIPARAYNAMIDAAKFAAKRKLAIEQGHRAVSGVVMVKNDANARKAFTIAGVSDVMLHGATIPQNMDLSQANDSEYLSAVAFKIEDWSESSTDGHGNAFVVLMQPLGPNEVGLAVVSGPTFAWVQFDNVDCYYAAPDQNTDDTLMGVTGGPARILYPGPDARDTDTSLLCLVNVSHAIGDAIHDPKDCTYEGVHQSGGYSSWIYPGQSDHIWKRDDPLMGEDGTRGLDLTLLTGVEYDAGDHTFYQYSVNLEFDTCGCLYEATKESRTPIFTTEPCS